MEHLQTSLLRIYSVGTVAKDIVLGEREIEVFPIEVLGDSTGELGEHQELKTDVNNLDGTVNSIKIKKGITLKATWLALGNSNRITPPNVVKGETVLIFQYSDTDEFYWVKIHNDTDLRRKEQVIHMYGNTDKFGEPLTDKNTYWQMIDTINKLVVLLKANNNDGEPNPWDIYINTKEGKFVITDSVGESVLIDSVNHIYDLKTKNKILTETKNSVHKVKEREHHETGQHFSIKTKTFKVQNDTTELISLLIEYINTHIEEQHIGNLGLPTQLTNAFISKYQDIVKRLSTLKE